MEDMKNTTTKPLNTNNMEKTAVEWLCNEWLYIDQEFDMNLIDKKTYWERLRSIQKQAKVMEKRQELKMPDYNLDELAKTEYPIGEVWSDEQALIRKLAFQKGFQKALELLTFKSE